MFALIPLLLPFRFELLGLRPQLRVLVQSVDWDHDKHALRDCESIDLNGVFGYSFSASSRRVEPGDKIRLCNVFIRVNMTSDLQVCAKYFT